MPGIPRTALLALIRNNPWFFGSAPEWFFDLVENQKGAIFCEKCNDQHPLFETAFSGLYVGYLCKDGIHIAFDRENEILDISPLLQKTMITIMENIVLEEEPIPTGFTFDFESLFKDAFEDLKQDMHDKRDSDSSSVDDPFAKWVKGIDELRNKMDNEIPD